MADTAPKVAAEEICESLAAVGRKANALAKQIKKSKLFIVFTGAGISTSAVVPEDSWLPRPQWQVDSPSPKASCAVSKQTHCRLFPRYHIWCSLSCKTVIFSGFLSVRIVMAFIGEAASCLRESPNYVENNNRESCNYCNKEYIRDFRAVSTYENGIHDHRTGRKCARCGGTLIDTIIDFDESLPKRDLDLAYQHAELADLCLVLGSSLTVTPACTIPTKVGERKGAKLAICNLQKMPVDNIADYRIFTETGTLMVKLMKKLDLLIPPFVLRRRLIVKIETQEEGRHKVEVTGVDSDETPVTFLRSVRLKGSRRVARAEPYIIHVRNSIQPGADLRFELEFMGHYNEPNLELVHSYIEIEEVFYLLVWSPYQAVDNRKTGDFQLERAVEYMVLDPQAGLAELM